MLGPIYVENSGRLLGTEWTNLRTFYRQKLAYPLQRNWFDLIQEALSISRLVLDLFSYSPLSRARVECGSGKQTDGQF